MRGDTRLPDTRPDSPCIKVCELDEHGVCIGCGRDLSEIASWQQMSPEEQWRTRARAALRLDARKRDC